MSACVQCGLPVRWINGGTKARPKWRCENPDGTDHWDKCSAERFARVKREGTYFEGDDGRREVHGYAAPHKTQLTMIRPLKPIVGKKYRPDGCDCGRPPWELCSNDCRHAIAPAPCGHSRGEHREE